MAETRCAISLLLDRLILSMLLGENHRLLGDAHLIIDLILILVIVGVCSRKTANHWWSLIILLLLMLIIDSI